MPGSTSHHTTDRVLLGSAGREAACARSRLQASEEEPWAKAVLTQNVPILPANAESQPGNSA